jgi:hypothetical protein
MQEDVVKDRERTDLHEFRAAVERTLGSGPYHERFENCVETGTGSLRIVTEGYADPRLVTFAQSGTMHAPEGAGSLPESRMVEGDLYQLMGAEEWVMLPGAGCVIHRSDRWRPCSKRSMAWRSLPAAGTSGFPAAWGTGSSEG